uniref:TACO1/YebC-like second and third domain-containing protein n=1 Tax=Chenopodium quinoa TaxID=63459 RepID=A0A803N398_CHEQI
MSTSSSSIRAFGAVLQRFSPLKSHSLSSSSLHWNCKIWRSFSSSSLWGSQLLPHDLSRQCDYPSASVRTIWSSSPLCMGRRSSKIATRKAKELDVPKEIVERNIKKASEKGQEAFIEKVYEVYGYGGVGFVVEVSTDKVNRSVAAVREVVRDCGGKMADSGSVVFRFKRARVVNVKISDADKDQLLGIALDAGAEDVIEPSDNEDDSEEDQAERYYKIVCSAENYASILSKLRDEGINFEPDNGYELLPVAPIEADDEAMELNKELMSKLLELDDVDAVYTDQK